MEVLDYSRLVSDFEAKLVTQLRNHSAKTTFLESWVPDQDPVKSVLNMVEAAAAYGQAEMAVRFGAAALSVAQLRALITEISPLADVSVHAPSTDDDTILVMTRIGAQA